MKAGNYFEGFRSLSTNGIDKPILNLFRMLGMMGGERVAVTSTGSVPLATQVATGVRGAANVDALATRNGRMAAVLVWNYHDVAEPAPATPVVVRVQGISPGVRRVLVQNYRIDGTHSNAYTVWQQLGSPQQPTAGQYAKLKAEEGLQLLGSPTWMNVNDGTIEVKMKMPRESVSLLSLRW